MPGKLDNLIARFRDHTIELFNRHGLKLVGFWIPRDNTENLLMYIIEHSNQEEGLKKWAAFQADPEWQQVKQASEANGKLVDRIDRVFMDATEFSPIR